MSAQQSPSGGWKALVQGSGELDASQRQAFEQAIALISQRLQATLDKPAGRSAERFHLPRYIDRLERDFQADAGHDQLQQAAGLTAYWIVRLLAECLLEANERR
ncbi:MULTISPECIES: HrpW-specific chaperone [unclassified Pseudomonas]|uniref:HrpW-specific chaperone n=1 Tax=unclassified Pseudomonas TaxID=196821 RepID=UPI0030D9509F